LPFIHNINGLTWSDPTKVALSGAMSHIAGCMGSKVIVAINKDKEANIFSVAHFGIVGDYKEVLPALTAKLKELKSK
jgi:electron transfer flavoprotein alpha subunit